MNNDNKNRNLKRRKKRKENVIEEGWRLLRSRS